MYTKQLQNNFTQEDTFHLMLPDRDALREVSASNQERLHTFITNTAENNYLKPLLSNWLVWCLLWLCKEKCKILRDDHFAVFLCALWLTGSGSWSEFPSTLFPSMLLTGLCSKSICYAQQPCHPIPFLLVNSTPMLLRQQHSQAGCSPKEWIMMCPSPSQFYPPLPGPLSESGFT